jgi:hypothetical protein
VTRITLPVRINASDRRALTGPDRPVVSNRYVLLEEIGRGGMGIVYLSWDVVLRHVVAIKTLRPGEHISPEQVEALRREAALQIGLVHDGIVRLLHFEPWDKKVGPYIIMEYLPWVSGDRWVAEAGIGGLPIHSVLQVGIRVAMRWRVLMRRVFCTEISSRATSLSIPAATEQSWRISVLLAWLVAASGTL